MHENAKNPAHTIRKEMALTEKMFLDTLPRALGSDAFVWDGHTVVLEDDNRNLSISFRPLADFVLGGFRVPRAEVILQLTGYDDSELNDAVARFDRYFQRGGG